MIFTRHFFISLPGGVELSKGDGVESEHVQRLLGHLPSRGAAAELHRAAGGDGEQFSYSRMAKAASRSLACSYSPSPGKNEKVFSSAVIFQ